MAIQAKDIKFYIWKFLEFSLRTVSFYVKKYPVASGVLSSFFLLYLLFPFIFKLLVCALPILACIAAGVSRYLSSSRVEGFKRKGKVNRDFPHLKSDSARDGNLVRRSKKPLISAQMSKRRNFKMKLDDLDAQGPLEVKLAESSVPDHNFMGKTEVAVEVENPIIGEPERYQFAQGATCRKAENMDEPALQLGGASEPQKANIGLGGETSEGFVGNGGPSTSQFERDLEEAEDDDEEDQAAQDDGNKVVEWNEDDQKNVMDLGFSELERNRRLENLIAKRRARKLMTAALRGPPSLLDLDSNVPSGYVSPIQITKKNPFDILPTGTEEEMLDSHIPGSAPSILLPARSPFDIPYDPLEEKPNLMTDGFQQEFSATSQPRDIFCRHESFTLGPSFSAEIYEDQGLAGPSLYSRPDRQVPRLPRFRRLADKGDHERLVEDILYHDHNSSDHDQQESKSPSLKNGQEGNTEKGDSSEENSGDESGNSKVMELNISPQDEVLTKPEEGDAKSNSSSTSEVHEQEVMSKENGEGEGTSEMGNLEHFPKETNSPEEGSPNASGSGTANGPFYSSRGSIIEYLDKGVGHSTTYSIASDMHVEVSELGSPRNIPDDIMSPPDFLEEDELTLKELDEADHHQQEAAADLETSGVKEHFMDPSLLVASIRDIVEEDSGSETKTFPSSPTTNPEEGHSEDRVGSDENTRVDKESRERKRSCPDSLEAETAEDGMQYIDNSVSHEHEEIPGAAGSLSMKIGNRPNEIAENSNEDDTNGGHAQHFVDEIRNQTEQDVIPHSGRLEEQKDINPSASPTEETSMTCLTINSTAQRVEAGDAKSEFAERLEGEFKTQAGEERNLSNNNPSN